MRFAVPPSTTRSSGRSTSVSSSTAVSVDTTGRSRGPTLPGRSPTISGASARRRSRSRALRMVRNSATRSSSSAVGISTTRCSTRPASVMSTSISRVGANWTTSRWRTALRASDGYCTTAT